MVLMSKMTPLRWLRIAGAGGRVAIAYLSYLWGAAAAGRIAVSAQLHAAISVWLASILGTIVGLAGVALVVARARAGHLDALRRELVGRRPHRKFPVLRVVGTAAVAAP